LILQQQKENKRILPSTAVFIDGDWLVYAVRKLAVNLDYARLLTAFTEHFGADTPVYFYVSVDEQNQDHNQFIASLKKIGYMVETSQLIRRGGYAISKGLDIRLAMKAASLPPEFDRLVLVSGDNDFVPLLQQARENGRSTVVVALPLIAGAALTAAPNRFTSLEDLITHSMRIPVDTPAVDEMGSRVPVPTEIYIEKGQHFAPYLVIRKLFMGAERELTVIDSHVDEQILYMAKLLPLAVVVQVFTDRIHAADFCVLVNKLRREGRQIHVYRTREFHDRYLRVDDEWWHSGHSFKDLGSRDSRPSKITKPEFLANLYEREKDLLADATEVCV
jgi:uncharacterized LabA/DUF88 family protein